MGQSWRVERRFRTFSEFYDQLVKRFPDTEFPSFPKKTFFTPSLEIGFVESRRVQLEIFLQQLLLVNTTGISLQPVHIETLGLLGTFLEITEHLHSDVVKAPEQAIPASAGALGETPSSVSGKTSRQSVDSGLLSPPPALSPRRGPSPSAAVRTPAAGAITAADVVQIVTGGRRGPGREADAVADHPLRPSFRIAGVDIAPPAADAGRGAGTVASGAQSSYVSLGHFHDDEDEDSETRSRASPSPAGSHPLAAAVAKDAVSPALFSRDSVRFSPLKCEWNVHCLRAGGAHSCLRSRLRQCCAICGPALCAVVQQAIRVVPRLCPRPGIVGRANPECTVCEH